MPGWQKSNRKKLQSVIKSLNYDQKLPLTFKGAGFLEVQASDAVELELSYQANTNVEITILLLQLRSNSLVLKI